MSLSLATCEASMAAAAFLCMITVGSMASHGNGDPNAGLWCNGGPLIDELWLGRWAGTLMTPPFAEYIMDSEAFALEVVKTVGFEYKEVASVW